MSSLRINFHAGPGVGKTYVATGITHRLMGEGADVALTPEAAKNHAYGLKLSGRRIIGVEQQLQIFNQQLADERLRLAAGVALVVNDGNPLISLMHAMFYQKVWEGGYPEIGIAKHPAHQQAAIIGTMTEKVRELDDAYPALNIFLLPPSDATYQQSGRYQPAAEAQALHTFECDHLKARYGNALHFHATSDLDGIMTRVRHAHQIIALAA